jgi:Zn-dependent protease
MGDVTVATPTYCARHPDVETLLSCTRCGRPACPDCLVAGAVGNHCVDCVRGQRREKTHAVTSHASLRRPGLLFYGIVAAFLASCAWAASTPVEGVTRAVSTRIAPILVVILGWTVSLCLHEWAHAFVAYRSGDRTVPEKGYLTLDPRRYADPIWSVAIPIGFLIIGGFGLPGGAVWIERHRIRSRHLLSLVSLAGPAMNVAFGLGVLGLVKAGVFDGVPVLNASLAFLGLLEFVTAILNLLPIPGLDGYGAIEPYLPYGVRAAVAPIAGVGVFLLFALLVYTGAGNALWDAGLWCTDLLGIDRLLIDAGRFLSDLQLL